MKIFKVITGEEVLVDDDTYQEVIKYRWRLDKDGYVRRSTRKKGKPIDIRLHRYVMKARKGVLVDHVNFNKLDNQRQNLRKCSTAESNRHRPACKNKLYSKYKGVCFSKTVNKFVAQIKHNGKTKGLGYFENEEDAARAYDKYAKKVFKKFAFLNFTYEQI